MTDESHNSALPLDELSITPQWVRAAPKTFEPPKSDEREKRRPDRPPKKWEQAARLQPKHATRGGRVRATSDRVQKSAQTRQEPAPLTLNVDFLPEENALAAMLDAIKQSPRAYAWFDLAKLVLNKPERHRVKLSRPGEPLFLVKTTEMIFPTQAEALRSILQSQTLLKEIKTPVEPPKGTFAFVNRCGITGEVLGPPNYHGYQSRLVQHHQQKLRHVPFDDFKRRIETLRDEAAVRRWIESMSTKTEYACTLCAEPKNFPNYAEAEKHVAEVHLDELIIRGNEITVSGPASRRQQHGGIAETLRQQWEQERRYPLKTAQALASRFEQAALHFIRYKNLLYLSRIKPQRFESITSLSESIQKIVTFLRAHEGFMRKQLIAELGPAIGEERLLADLHWLVGDGYIVEFYDGRLWALGDKPPKPAQPEANSEIQNPAFETNSKSESEMIPERPLSDLQ